jgi:hypothetical protein
VEHIVAATPANLQTLLRAQFDWGRALDRGNPNAGNIGSDFGRLGVVFWREMYAVNPQNRHRRDLLDELIEWRNAITHHDFSSTKFGGAGTLRLAAVKRWRRALNRLARAFDKVMHAHLQSLLGAPPW